jgi:hypothetical protein
MLKIGIPKYLVTIAYLLLLLSATGAAADARNVQKTLSVLVERLNRSEIGRIELFWEDLDDLTQTNISPRDFAAMKIRPHLLGDHTYTDGLHKIYIDTANKVLRSEIGNAVKSLDATLLHPSASVDIRLSIAFYDLNDSEIATLYFSHDGAFGAVNFNEVEFKRNELFDMLKKHYVDPQAEIDRKREEIRQARLRALRQK